MDSYKIAALIRGGNFPLAYVYPRNMRATRDLLRRRTGLVRHGADLKAHVVNTTSQYNLPPNKVNLKNVSVREQLGRIFDSPLVQRNIDAETECLLAGYSDLKPASTPNSKPVALIIHPAGVHQYPERVRSHRR